MKIETIRNQIHPDLIKISIQIKNRLTIDDQLSKMIEKFRLDIRSMRTKMIEFNRDQILRHTTIEIHPYTIRRHLIKKTENPIIITVIEDPPNVIRYHNRHRISMIEIPIIGDRHQLITMTMMIPDLMITEIEGRTIVIREVTITLTHI